MAYAMEPLQVIVEKRQGTKGGSTAQKSDSEWQKECREARNGGQRHKARSPTCDQGFGGAASACETTALEAARGRQGLDETWSRSRRRTISSAQ
jgi:hypothetical protein